MSRRAAARVAWSLWAAALILVGLAVAFAALNRHTSDGASPVDIFVFVELTFPTVGALIASRRPENPIGWIFCSIGLLQALSIFAGGYARYALLTEPGSLPLGAEMSWLESWSWVPGLGLLVTFLLLLFPTGRLPSPRWQWAAWLAASGIALLVAAFATAAWPERGVALLDAVDEEPEGVVLFLAAAGLLMVGAAALASIGSLFVRLRRARGDEREQLKWFFYAGVVVVVATVSASTPLRVPEIVLDLGLVTIPIATGFAILRYRLYDIDRIVNRTIVYGALTAGLAGLYFGIVVGLQQVFSSITSGNGLAVAGSTLAVAALFRPARRRIQATVDRRFYRRKYDSQRTLEAFSARLRDEIDLDSLSAELRAVVRATMQPAHVSLWLRSSRGRDERT